jgi:hypothetical protein
MPNDGYNDVSAEATAGPSTLHPSDEDLSPGIPVSLSCAQDDSLLSERSCSQ